MDKKSLKYYNKKGELHCEFQPAIIISEDGIIKEIHCYLNGVEYSENDWFFTIRRNLPDLDDIRIPRHFESINYKGEKYYYVFYYPIERNRRKEEHYKSSTFKVNNEAKYFNLDGEINYIEDYKNEKITVDENNYIHTYNDYPGREVNNEVWYFNHGKLHNIFGPAHVKYYEDSEKTASIVEYCLDGVEYSEDEWFEEIKNRGFYTFDEIKNFWFIEFNVKECNPCSIKIIHPTIRFLELANSIKLGR